MAKRRKKSIAMDTFISPHPEKTILCLFQYCAGLKDAFNQKFPFIRCYSAFFATSNRSKKLWYAPFLHLNGPNRCQHSYDTIHLIERQICIFYQKSYRSAKVFAFWDCIYGLAPAQPKAHKGGWNPGVHSDCLGRDIAAPPCRHTKRLFSRK